NRRAANNQSPVDDRASTNGTYVNERRTNSRRPQDADYLRVGRCIYRFHATGNVETDYHQEILRLAVLDPLTGAHNRRSLDEFLILQIDRARRHARPLAAVVFGIDPLASIAPQ